MSKSALLVTTAALGLVLLTYCASKDDDPQNAPGTPDSLHPNTTSPDEQGESGSLIEH
jgi:hypothetical protein